MKIILIALLLAAASQNAFAQIDNDIDIRHYEYAMKVNDDNDSLVISAVIDMHLLKAVDKVWLDLISVKPNGKGMKVSGVWMDETDKPLSFTHSDDILRINLGGKLTGDQKIRIDYRGIPADGIIISRNKFNQRTFFSDNWPNRGRNWLVCKDHPSDKAALDFIVTAPDHYQVVSNGVQVEETNIDEKTKLTHWRETVDLPVKVFAIGIAEFAVQYQGDAKNIPVYSWVFPKNKLDGFDDYAVAKEILPFFMEHVGPYAYKKLANVQSKTIFGGLENASAIFYFENSVTGERKDEELISHEIAHQWFGNMVTEKDWPHFWLSEGFATYFEELYKENKYGEEKMNEGLEKNRKKIIAYSKKVMRPVVDTTVTDYMQMLNPNSYEKGGWVLHMLRRQIGDSAFWKGIRSYYAKYAGKNVNTDDFRMEMEQSSKRDLKPFFREWLYQSGHPLLKITHVYTNKTLTVTIVQQNEHLFEFPLAIRIKNKEGEVMKSVRVTQKETVVNIPMDSDATELTPDPNHNLLFEMAP